MIKRTLLLVAAAALASASHAQGRGGMMRMFQGGTLASAMMLGREDVQAEIKLTDEQKGQIDAKRASAQERIRNFFTEMRSSGNFNPQDSSTQTKMQNFFEDMSKDSLSVLTPAQTKRLGELAIQSRGAMAVVQPDVAKELGITAAQKAKIDDLQRLMNEANEGLYEKVRENEMDRDEMFATVQKNAKSLDVEIEKVLTPKQRAKLKELGGAPFEFKDPKPGTPGSWGRPGGR